MASSTRRLGAVVYSTPEASCGSRVDTGVPGDWLQPATRRRDDVWTNTTLVPRAIAMAPPFLRSTSGSGEPTPRHVQGLNPSGSCAVVIRLPPRERCALSRARTLDVGRVAGARPRLRSRGGAHARAARAGDRRHTRFVDGARLGALASSRSSLLTRRDASAALWQMPRTARACAGFSQVRKTLARRNDRETRRS